MSHRPGAHSPAPPPHHRRSLALRAGLTLTVLAGLAAGAPAAGAADVVNVYNWNDYITDAALEGFTEATGIEVVYDVYDSNEVMEAKLLTGNAGYDVVFPTARPFGTRQVAAGVHRRLDRSRLPHHDNLAPDILATLTDIDPGNAHLVPYMWGTTGIGYVEEAVRARLGDEVPLDSWDLIFDPAIAAKLEDCGIAVLDAPEESLPPALIWAGRNGDAVDPDDLETAVDVYLGVRPYIRYFDSAQYISDLASGDICIAMGYSGDVLQAADRAREAGNGVTVKYVIPREGAFTWVDTMAIPKDAPHPLAAHAFIDWLLRAEVIAGISNEVAFANANGAATPLLDPAISGNPGIYPSPETRAKLQVSRNLSQRELRARTRAWSRIRRGR
ncbi:MAG TPA: polyamine ABC transporter substrate-binding protein [Pseudomonadales bacterium]|nr:polyamine ABC transporter substrate-binding protein [Pseudomonadales bacterium]